MTWTLPGEPASVPAARHHLEAQLRGSGVPQDVQETAVLLLSEVVTNAVLHARTPLALEIERVAGAVRVTVSDGSPRQPPRRRHGLHAGTGRGLGLLATLATDWGSERGQHPWQKDVWFELPTDPTALPDPGEGALNNP